MESYVESIDKLIGKNILFFDLETTGFPRYGNKSMPGGYADYTDNSSYDSARILQIGWYYHEKFSKDYFNPNVDDVKSIIRKPFNFKMDKVPNEVVKKHSITCERTLAEGTYIKPILKGDFGECLLACDYIVAFNAYFDFSILANEIHRTHYEDLYNKIMDLKHKVVCVMDICRKYIGVVKTQKEAYKYFYLRDPISQHDAKNDVLTMLELLNYILKNPKSPKIINNCENKQSALKYIRKFISNRNITNDEESITIDEVGQRENRGQKWSDKEDNELKSLYLAGKKTIHELATIHKRSEGGIKSRLKRLEILRNEDDAYVPLADTENDRIKNMYINDNKNIEEIAKIYNRSVGGIKTRLNKLGILRDEDNDSNSALNQRIKHLENQVNELKILCNSLKKQLEVDNVCKK